MVIIDQMPDEGTIRALRGKVDFYRRGNRTIARAWPRKTKHVPTQAELDQQNHLKLAMGAYNSISPIEKSYLWLQSWPGNFTTRDTFMKQYFGTMLYPKLFPAFFYPAGTHVPFPDPVQTYFGVRSRVEIVGDDGRWKLRVLFTSPGTYTLNFTADFPTTSMHFYRRRGYTLRGAVEWFYPAGLLTLGVPSDSDGLVDFDYATVLANIGSSSPFRYYFTKQHSGGSVSRAFSASFGHSTPFELFPPDPPGSQRPPGSTLTWPASPPFQGAYLFQPVFADPFAYVPFPPTKQFIDTLP